METSTLCMATATPAVRRPANVASEPQLPWRMSRPDDGRQRPENDSAHQQQLMRRRASCT